MSSLARDFFYFLASSSFKYHSSMFNFWPKIWCVQFMWFFDCISLGPFQWLFLFYYYFIIIFYFFAFIASPLGPFNDYFYFIISYFYFLSLFLFIIYYCISLGPFQWLFWRKARNQIFHLQGFFSLGLRKKFENRQKIGIY